MANRVTEAEVLEIIDVDSSISDISPFITAANLFVTNVFSGDTQVGADTLKEIERYVAAHFICCRDPRAVEEQNEGIKVKYAGGLSGGRPYKANSPTGLHSTAYGQNALLLDFTGKMVAAGKNKATFAMVDYSTDV